MPAASACRASQELEALLPELSGLVPRGAPRTDLLERHRAEGLWYLVHGTRGDAADRAIESLESAAGLAGVQLAAVLSDLAAAYLLRAGRDDSFEDLLRGLAAVNRAVSEEPSLPEARFNRALILGALELRRSGQQAWQEYLDLESDGGWAYEARIRLATLQQPSLRARWAELRRENEISEGDPALEYLTELADANQLIEEAVHERLLPRWAEGEVGTAELASELRSTGRAALELSGDRFLTDLAADLSSADPRRVDLLRHLQREFIAGRQMQSRRVGEQAVRSLATVAEQFEEAGSSYSGWVRLRQADAAYDAKDREQALAIARSTIEQASSASHLTLSAQAGWLAGLLLLEQGKPARALGLFDEAAACFERAGQLGNLAAIRSLRAVALFYLGLRSEAWRETQLALRASNSYGNEERTAIALGSAARQAVEDGHGEAALALQNEALLIDLAGGDPLAVAESYWWRAEILAGLEQREAALADLRAARRSAAQIANPDIAAHTGAGLDVAEGRILRSVDPQSSLLAFDRALSVYQAAGFHFNVAEALLERARTARALRETVKAQADLRAALATYEAQRATITRRRDRREFFERARVVFDELISLLIEDLGAAAEAFAYSEMSRSRSLIDVLLSGEGSGFAAPEPQGPAALAAKLPKRSAVVEFSVQADASYAWVVRGGVAHVRRIEVTRAELERLLEAFLTAARSRAAKEAFQPLARRLHAALFGDLLRLPAGVDTLVVVPDAPLHRLPFGALLDLEGRYLSERYELVVAPSATLATLLFTQSDQRSNSRDLSVLAVGDPVYGIARPELPRLASSGAEAAWLASAYPAGRLLVREEATVGNVVAAMPHHQIIHLAAHTLPIDEDSTPAVALTADSEHPSGALRAERIEALPLSHSRLVVLAACRSASGRLSVLEGPLGLTSAFLAAGTPVVLATLWEIEDREASVFLRRFHEALLRSRDPLRALRTVQSELAADEPGVWAAFQLYGAPIDSL